MADRLRRYHEVGASTVSPVVVPRGGGGPADPWRPLGRQIVAMIAAWRGNPVGQFIATFSAPVVLAAFVLILAYRVVVNPLVVGLGRHVFDRACDGIREVWRMVVLPRLAPQLFTGEGVPAPVQVPMQLPALEDEPPADYGLYYGRWTIREMYDNAVELLGADAMPPFEKWPKRRHEAGRLCYAVGLPPP
jgi:hypothetical protein